MGCQPGQRPGAVGVVGDGGGGGQCLGQDGGLLICGQVGRQPGQRASAGRGSSRLGDGGGGGQRLGQDGGLISCGQVGRQRGQRPGAGVVVGEGGGGGQRLGQQVGGRWGASAASAGRRV